MYVIIIVLLCFVYVCRKQLKPVYISGMPGTGKTATVLAAVNSLKEEVGRSVAIFCRWRWDYGGGRQRRVGCAAWKEGSNLDT